MNERPQRPASSPSTDTDPESLVERDNARTVAIHRALAEGFSFIRIYRFNEPSTPDEEELRARERQEIDELIEANGPENVISLQPPLAFAEFHGGYYGDDPTVRAYFARLM